VGKGLSLFVYRPAGLHSELEFLKSLWGLGTEKEEVYRTGPPEPVFLNVYGAQKSIPRNEFRQPM
jgi:hypothetical protein